MVEETFPILWPQVAQLRYASLQGKEKQNMESDIFRLEEAFFKMCIQIGYDSVMCHNKCRANITDRTYPVNESLTSSKQIDFGDVYKAMQVYTLKKNTH